jgi:hypothetical protein
MKKTRVLNTRVPAGGRRLTSAECRALRAEGISCGAEWVVMPYAPNINHGGPLYRPCKTGGFDNTGHVLEVTP